MVILYTVLTAIGLLWGLAIFYFAVMNLKRVRERGELTKFMLVIGLPMLWIGLILDLLVNVFIFSILFLEIPQEPLVTGRLKRHKYHGTGWRHRFALWWEKHIDPFEDKPGGHI